MRVFASAGVVRTAAALGRPPNMPLSSVVPLLQELPEDAVSVGGSLHLPVRGLLLTLLRWICTVRSPHMSLPNC